MVGIISVDRLLNQTWTIRTISPFSEPWNVDDLNSLGSHITSYFQDFVKTEDKVERDGTSVTLEWVYLDELKFLFVDMHLADEPKSQVVLCYPRIVSDENLVESFEFAMMHGDSKVCQITIQWLEKLKGCMFGRNSIRLTANHIEHFLIDTLKFVDPETAKLEITLATPPVIKNLDSLSITIPPRALHSLFVDLQQHQHLRRKKNDSRVDHASHSLLQTLRLFILEEFGIDMSNFNLIQVSNPIAILSAYGKIRLQDKQRIGDILILLRNIIMEITAPLGEVLTTENKTVAGTALIENKRGETDTMVCHNRNEKAEILTHISDDVEINCVSI